MDIDSEYAKFMSELGETPAQPSPGPGRLMPPPPGLPRPPLASPPRYLPPPQQTHASPSAMAPPSMPPPLAPPPGRPPGSSMMPPAGLGPPAALPAPPPPVARPAGPPPPLSSRPEHAVMSAPAQPAAPQPAAAIAPPSHAPPSMNPPHYAYPNVPSTSKQHAYAPMLLDPEMLREEILSEKKDSKRKKKPKEGVLRAAGGETWIDDKMDVWPANDFRIFVGNLGPEVNEDILAKSFNQFPSYAKCRIVKDYKKNKAKGYGFVSFTDHTEGIKALKQMNGNYIGNRPCQLKKSTHDIRNVPTDGKKRKAMLANPLERITTKRMR